MKRRKNSEDHQGRSILFLSREKVRKNKIFKNNELKIDPLFGNTSPSDSVHGLFVSHGVGPRQVIDFKDQF